MKKCFSVFLFAALLLTPFLGQAQRADVQNGRPMSTPQDFKSSGAVASYSSSLIEQILTEAAPHFGMSVDAFIREYNSCSCITITQIGPNTYYVVYGGIGIQIVIDDGRHANPNAFLKKEVKDKSN